MFFALDAAAPHHRVDAATLNPRHRDARSDRAFICPTCGRAVIPRFGESKRWHFAHLVNTTCEGGGESEAHAYAKTSIEPQQFGHDYHCAALEGKALNLVSDLEAISAERQCGRPRKGTAVSNPASHQVGSKVTAKASSALDRAATKYGVSRGVLVEAFARALDGTSDADE